MQFTRRSGGGTRRVGFRGMGVAANPPALITSFDGMSATNHWAGAANGEPQGSGTFTAAIIFRLDAATAPANEIWFGHGPNAGADGGWTIGVTAAGLLRGVVVNAVNTAIVTPTYSWVAGDVGKYHTVVLTHDGAVIKLYRNGAIVGTSTVCVGYAVPDVDIKTAIGCGYNGVGATVFGGTIVSYVGMAVSEGTALSAANVTTWHNDSKTLLDVADFAGPAQYRWQASDNVGLASPWTDDIGGVALTRVGTGGTLVQEVPTWG